MASNLAMTDYAYPDELQNKGQHHPPTANIMTPSGNDNSRTLLYCIGVISLVGLCLSVAAIALVLFNASGIRNESVGSADPQGSGTAHPTTACQPSQCPTTESAKLFSPTESQMAPKPDTSTGSSSYVRWGRTTCSSNSTLVYAGIAGGHLHSGSGSNYLCLPENPEYDDYETGDQRLRSRVHSAEYETSDFSPLASNHNHDVPCAVCRVQNRGSALMIPAKMTCPSGWTKEYHGYLMADYYDRASPTEFICLDRDAEIIPGSAADQGGVLMYPAEGRCNSNLPCVPYIQGAELTCVVCSK